MTSVFNDLAGDHGGWEGNRRTSWAGWGQSGRCPQNVLNCNKNKVNFQDWDTPVFRCAFHPEPNRQDLGMELLLRESHQEMRVRVHSCSFVEVVSKKLFTRVEIQRGPEQYSDTRVPAFRV